MYLTQLKQQKTTTNQHILKPENLFWEMKKGEKSIYKLLV